MFNFLDSKLSPKVYCSSPSTDDYEIENIISQDFKKRIRGFLAYSTIKPPIEIEFEFICPVNIHFININSIVGKQKCTGIEILAKSSTHKYTSIAKSIYVNDGVIFCNSRKYSSSNVPPNSNSSYHMAFFKGNTFRNFLNASSVKVIIFRTEKSVPCLGSVEVWGTPSKNCSSTTIQTITRIMDRSESVTDINGDSPDTTISKNSISEFFVPDDFKDDLTYDVMAVPMTLPSGKTVDQSTIDKHIESEASFGRKPCDPFTGIKFTEKIKPVLNVALKSRIDMFLLQNSHKPETFGLKRTLGRISTTYPKRFKSDINSGIDHAATSTGFNEYVGHEKLCCSCKRTLLRYFYLLPCKHSLCRECLLKISKNLMCSTCDKHFSSGNVQKCNV